MRVVGLISGGKDSMYNMMRCMDEGHEIVALANLHPVEADELDSFMYQTVGHTVISSIAVALQLPLYRQVIRGSAKDKTLEFSNESLSDEDDEVNSLLKLLNRIKSEIAFDAVSVGAIHSTYQNNRVNFICERLNCMSLGYLWQLNEDELLTRINESGIRAVIVKVAACGLTEKFIGRYLHEISHELRSLAGKYGLHVCGEGGEFETIVLDCPLFKKQRLHLKSFDFISDPTGAVHMTNIVTELVNKESIVEI